MAERVHMVAQIDSRFTKKSIKKTYTRLISYLLYEGRPLTTKGQWINPFVFLSYKIQEKLPFKKNVKEPIFILGTGRSGTTILGVTLGIHKEVGFLNEPKALWSHLYPHEDLIGSYQEQEGRYYLSEADVDVDLVNRAHSLFGSYLNFSLSNRLVDKYPELIFRVPFVSKIFPDAKYLFLYRNGWDTCHSIKHWSERLGLSDVNGSTHDWWGKDNRKWKLLCSQVVAKDPELAPNIDKISAYTNHIHMAAVEWIVTMKQGIRLMSEGLVYPVKYEEFVSSQVYRDELLEFCRLDKDKTFNTYCDEVLKAPNIKEKIELPIEISNEFNNVMAILGYE